MPFFEIDGIKPVVSKSAFVHPTATIIGDVIIGENCYVGPSAVMRGDFGRLMLMEGSNLQDTCVMHGFPNKETIVGKDGHIGHGAILHGCLVEQNAMVGMNSVIMDGAVIGADSIVGAMCFVKSNMKVPSKSLVVGNPANIIRTLIEEEIHWKRVGTKAYQELSKRSFESLLEVTPLETIEADRKQLQITNLVPLSEFENEK